MSKKSTNKSRKKYQRQTPTLREQLRESQDAQYDAARTFDRSFKEIQDRVAQLEQQVTHSHQLIDSQYAEINMLKETNVNLIEVINILGRKARMEKQETIFSAYNETINNNLQAVAAKKADCCGKGSFSD